jgi:hypothetical protein
MNHPDFFPYAVSHDGRRFLLTREVPRETPKPLDTPLVVVTQWTDALAR